MPFDLPGAEILAKPVQPDVAMAFWQSRASMTREEAQKLTGGAKARAFYVSGLAERDMVETVHAAMGAAIANGETLAGFKGRIGEVVASAGWQGHRVENIFRTNMQTAYAAGRYAKMQAVKEQRPFWQYYTIEDRRTRASHAVLHGLVYPAEHEFWGRNYPPNGFRCRCGVRTLSTAQVEAQGLTVQKAMPTDSLWTDPVTGMEYHVQMPGADKGFRGNVGKDWLEGLDLEKYPDLTPESYDEQRGVSSKRPAPVANYTELGAEVIGRCSHFATNSGLKRVLFDQEKYFMATNSHGTVWISGRTQFGRKGSHFNPAGDLKSAWNTLAGGKPLTWEEEYSLESLWHEITHNRQKHGRLARNGTAEAIMEVSTQWTARRTYHHLLESLGGKASHQPDILKNGLGYGSYVRRFDALLQALGIKDEQLLPHMLAMIEGLETPDYGLHLAATLADLSGARKSAVKRALSHLNKHTNFEEILKDCGLMVASS